jgi:hypothetical protein
VEKFGLVGDAMLLVGLVCCVEIAEVRHAHQELRRVVQQVSRHHEVLGQVNVMVRRDKGSIHGVVSKMHKRVLGRA